jgi:putative nucleotidyltransferase with HDIG domain
MSALPRLRPSRPDSGRQVRPSHRTGGRGHLTLVRDDERPPRLDPPSLSVIRRLGELMESNDAYTLGHCERVAEYAVAIGCVLGLTETELTTVRLGAYLHDLGKVHVPSDILNKPGRLDPEEVAVIRGHPHWGVALLSTVALPWDVEPIIRWHHERFDGSGYPDGLCGDEIPLAAQIIGIADTYDAMTSTRSYRPAASTDQALAALWESRGSWNPDVHTAFLTAVAIRATQSRISPWRRRMDTVESMGNA